MLSVSAGERRITPMSEVEPVVERALARAIEEARLLGSAQVEPLHLFVGALKPDGDGADVALRRAGIDPKRLRRRARALIAQGRQIDERLELSPRAQSILDDADARAVEKGRPLNLRDVLVALLVQPDEAMEHLLRDQGVAAGQLVAGLESGGGVAPPEADRRANSEHPPTPMLDKVGKDYTRLAMQGKLGPVIGREEELKEVIRILLQEGKSNPLLIGDPGVGKTAIVEALALHAVRPDARPEIRGLRVVEIVVAALVGGTEYRGQLEERLRAVLSEAEADRDLVLFIDELHAITGGASKGRSIADLSNLLKPALARGVIRLIGATTPGEFRANIEADAAFERRFQPVRVEEPSPERAEAILRGLRHRLEAHHGVTITDEAISASVELSVRYLPDRRLPDKARDLADKAAATARFATLSAGAAKAPDATIVGRDAIAAVVAKWTGIPVERLTADRAARLVDLEAALKRRVIGQDHAVHAVAQVVRTAHAGLARAGRPHGVFLFLGPTGVGKTELAKSLAEFLFGSERALLRFDMSEFKDKHTVQRLVGAPPGYIGYDEGGQLTNAVRRNPYSVLLFDEIEKAHPEVAQVFLQVFDDGRLTDGHGRTADFSNAIVIMTSNLLSSGPAEKRRHLGFGAQDRAADPPAGPRSTQEIRVALAGGAFAPELVNRITNIVEFLALGREHVRAIIDKILDGVRARLAERSVTLRVDDTAYDVFLRDGYRPESGARGMERLIEKSVVQPLANLVIEGRLPPGATVRIGSESGKVTLFPLLAGGM
ncbi:MAG: ATP-dependent Clp protease ATP-binding subunit [Polyangiaceae bacterium]